MVTAHKLKRLHIPYHDMLAFMRGEQHLTGLGLPADARVERVYDAYTSMSFCLVIHSEEFEPVAEGCEIPLLPPIGVERSHVLRVED
jgi:hypothetical protein